MTLNDLGRETVGALKGQPLLLVIVILNVLMLGLIGWSVRTAQENNRLILKDLIQKCLPGQPQP